VAVLEIEPSPAPPPALTIAHVDKTIRVSWPASATGFALQSSGSITSAPGWQPELNTPQVVGDQNEVTLEIGAGPRFFRLMKP
jgi:hypothetical protein